MLFFILFVRANKERVAWAFLFIEIACVVTRVLINLDHDNGRIQGHPRKVKPMGTHQLETHLVPLHNTSRHKTELGVSRI